MKNNESEQGFTLIEVLVSFAILSLSLTVLYTIMVDTSQRLIRSDGLGYVLAIADMKLKEASVSRPLQIGERGGITSNNYSWKSTIAILNEDEELNTGLALISIQLSVQSPQAGGPTVYLETRRLVGFDELQS